MLTVGDQLAGATDAQLGISGDLSQGYPDVAADLIVKQLVADGERNLDVERLHRIKIVHDDPVVDLDAVAAT